jgi:hypothetical protein
VTQQEQAQPNAPETTTEPAGDVAQDQFFDKMEQLLANLVPPSSVTIVTADGSSLEIPGAIPARRQVVVFRLMREMSEMPQVAKALSGLSTGEAGEIVDVVVAVSTDMEVMEKLGEIFAAAYPDSLDGRDPLDLLPIEEVVSALVPFSERFIKKVGGGLATLGQSASKLQ